MSETAKKFALPSLEARKKNQRFSSTAETLLHIFIETKKGVGWLPNLHQCTVFYRWILAEEDQHSALSASYDHLINQKHVSM